MGHTNPGQKKTCTVWLEPEVEGEGDKQKMFYCFNCRIPIIQYRGTIATIVPGNQPYTPNTIIKCKGSLQTRDGVWEECGQYYVFMGAAYSRDPEMK